MSRGVPIRASAIWGLWRKTSKVFADAAALSLLLVSGLEARAAVVLEGDIINGFSTFSFVAGEPTPATIVVADSNLAEKGVLLARPLWWQTPPPPPPILFEQIFDIESGPNRTVLISGGSAPWGIQILDLDTLSLTQVATPGRVKDIELHPNGDVYARYNTFTVDGYINPPTLVRVDLQTGDVIPFVDLVTEPQGAGETRLAVDINGHVLFVNAEGLFSANPSTGDVTPISSLMEVQEAGHVPFSVVVRSSGDVFLIGHNTGGCSPLPCAAGDFSVWRMNAARSTMELIATYPKTMSNTRQNWISDVEIEHTTGNLVLSRQPEIDCPVCQGGWQLIRLDPDTRVSDYGVLSRFTDRNTRGIAIVPLGIDTDGDGVSDFFDNCRDVQNFGQLDSDGDGMGEACDYCSDSDGDGFGDSDLSPNTCLRDNCPSVLNADQADYDLDSLGDACDDDDDGDGIPDGTDVCPRAADPSQEDADNDGIGNACNNTEDADGDEWADLLDNCPSATNPDQLNADSDQYGDGCDNCSRWASVDQSDTDGNRIGDVCECGDQSGDGRVNVVDLIAINLAIYDPSQAKPLCDTNFDGKCNVSDIVGANRKIFGHPAYCSRYPPLVPSAP